MTFLAGLYLLIAAGICWFTDYKTAMIIVLGLLVLLLVFMFLIFRYSFKEKVRRSGSAIAGEWRVSDNLAAPKPIRYTFYALYWLSIVAVLSSLFLVIDRPILEFLAFVAIVHPANVLWKGRNTENPDLVHNAEVDDGALSELTANDAEANVAKEMRKRKAETIRSFLDREVREGNVKIGFHRMRDQSPLYKRLREIGIRKPFFRDRRQFLRSVITFEPSIFQAVIDLVCVEGFQNGREVFWNAYGEECHPQFYFRSEIMFRLETREANEAFVEIL